MAFKECKVVYLTKRALLLFIIVFGACGGHQDSEEILVGVFDPIITTLGISFPPVSNEEQRLFTAPILEDLNVKHIRIGEEWRFREANQGVFNWEPLDNRINWANDNNIKILLTIQSNGPDWACSPLQNNNSCVYSDMNAFKNYVAQLLQRYPNKISKIQYGNEWQSNFWYIGNGMQFTQANNIVYNAIQEFSPNTKLVLGGFTTISLRFLAGCNNAIDGFYDDEGTIYDRSFLDENCNSQEIQEVKNKIAIVLENAQYDEVDIHLYDDVEHWGIYYETIKELVEKPIIVTEFGGPNLNIEPADEEYQAARLQRYIQKIDSIGIPEAYFFKLVEGSNNPAHAKSGLIRSNDLGEKSSYAVFKALVKQ